MLTRTATKRIGPALPELFSIDPHPPYKVEVCLKATHGKINLLTNQLLWIKYKEYDQTIEKLETRPDRHSDSHGRGRKPPGNSGHTPLLFFRKVSAFSSFLGTSLISIHRDIVNTFLLFFAGLCHANNPDFIRALALSEARNRPAGNQPFI